MKALRIASLVLLIGPVLLIGCAAPRASTVIETDRNSGEPSDSVLTGSDADSHAVVVRQSIERALPFIEREGTAWMEGRVSVQEGAACVSCHHVGYALWTHAEARRVGIERLTPAFDALAETAVAFLDRPSIPRAFSVGPILLAEPKRALALHSHLASLQTDTGSWEAVGQFPTQRRPVIESDAVATMYALLAMRSAPTLAQTSATSSGPETRVEAGRAWLAKQPLGASTEWLAWRLVLADAEGDGGLAAVLRRHLISRQLADGGWGWLANDPSEAFSTGQALYALASTDDRASEAVQAAVRYLTVEQDEDGSWLTVSRMISAEPSDEKDVIYHFWGTAWATIGLARTLPAATRPDSSLTLASTDVGY